MSTEEQNVEEAAPATTAGEEQPPEEVVKQENEDRETTAEQVGETQADGEGKEEEERVNETEEQKGKEVVEEQPGAEEQTEDGETATETEAETTEETPAGVEEGQPEGQPEVTPGVPEGETAEEIVETGEGGTEVDGSTEEGEIEREEKTAGDGGDEGDGKNGEDGERGETPAEETAATGEVSVGVTRDEEEGVVKEKEVGVAPSVVESADSNIGTTSRAPLDNIIEEEEEEEEHVDRDELIIDCRETLRRQEKLRRENAQLQHKIADYLSHKKEEKPDPGRNVTDQEKRYLQCMSALDQLEVEMEEVRGQWVSREEEVREMCVKRQAEVQHKTEEFLRYQLECSREAVDSRSGHRLTETELKRLQAAQLASDKTVFQARLENIKLSNKIERMESQLKEKEELAEGLHMLDFEQLKIGNMDLGEKVEERNEEIRKLTDKIRDTVQVLTHVKEKLNFLQDESEEKKEQLQQLDSDLSRRREVLTRLKQTRDSLRLDNQRLRQRGGLVCHTQLLRDFEDRQDQNTELEMRLEQLQRQHSQTTAQCTGLRDKITHTTTSLHLT